MRIGQVCRASGRLILNAGTLDAYKHASRFILEIVMSGILLSGLIVILGLLFGVIAIWASVKLARDTNKPAPRPRPRTPARIPAGTDPFSVQRLRRGQPALQ